MYEKCLSSYNCRIIPSSRKQSAVLHTLLIGITGYTLLNIIPLGFTENM